MRNIEESVGSHRRLTGVGKSKPGDDVGTFDFKFRHNPHIGERKAVCVVSRGQGWECLNILFHERTRDDRYWPRAPIFDEIQKLLPLFFRPDEHPVQFHSGTAQDGRAGVNFFLSERTKEVEKWLPEFGPYFSLTKKPQ